MGTDITCSCTKCWYEGWDTQQWMCSQIVEPASGHTEEFPARFCPRCGDFLAVVSVTPIAIRCCLTIPDKLHKMPNAAEGTMWVVCYTITCAGCGAGNDDNRWTPIDIAETVAMYNGFEEINGRWLCENCQPSEDDR